jgi:hypothetical protein
MAKVELDLLGGKAVRRMFAIAAEKVGPQLAKEMNASALTIEKEAKRLAPANFGKLRQSIKHNIGEPLMKSVYSELGYAPYVEFGTKSKAMTNPIHKGFSAYAAQFKGKGEGNYKDMIDSLILYVKRKKLAGTYKVKSRRRLGNAEKRLDEDTKMAKTMAYFILKNGIKPQPFLIPAYLNEKPKLIKRIVELLKFK